MINRRELLLGTAALVFLVEWGPKISPTPSGITVHAYGKTVSLERYLYDMEPGGVIKVTDGSGQRYYRAPTERPLA